ncbi:hypothetical protein IC614_08310 [Allosphingosinicella flava]|uniref:Filamentous haemagglutinin FhaB/tRNA nuclease CdiA-like TPS domain-containing protein n=1 Tax=Allosphingosinicella flava TaxID=2771430 RepID=A0A7T2LLB8_9SPHN|nr:YDG domain-containing protein [Sphingosinicella flava]QPQ54355.1 hypothetical protein IC614_08310 [Sphingosinicella flava]
MTRTLRTGRKALLLQAALGTVFVALIPADAVAQSVSTVGGIVTSTNANGSGSTDITTSGITTSITLGNSRTIVNWATLNLPSGRNLNFIFNNRGDIVLNRLASGTATINGSVVGTMGSGAGPVGGNVWFTAPGGVVFNNGAIVNVGGLLATTAPIADGNFLFGGNSFSFAGAAPTSSVTVRSGAQLIVNGGTLALIAPVVITEGSSFINDSSTGANSDVLFGAAQDYTITFAPDANGDLDLMSWTVPSSAVGSSSATPIDLSGSVDAGNVYLGAVSSRALADAIITVTGNVRASGAVANSDGNIVLVAGGGISSGAPTIPMGAGINLNTFSLFSNRDMTLVAGQLLNTNSASRTVGRNYAITAGDFTGGAFQPSFSTTTGDLTITDTAGGLVLNGLTAPGTLTVNTLNGSITILGSGISSTNENIVLSAGGSGIIQLDGDVTATALGRSVSLSAFNAIIQNSGTIATNTLTANSVGASVDLDNVANAVTTLGASSAAGGFHYRDANGLVVSGAINGGGGVTLTAGAGATLNISNASVQAAGGSINLAGDTVALANSTVSNSGGQVAIAGAASLTGNVQVSANGNASFSGTVDGAGSLVVNSPGMTTFGGAVGGNTALTSLVTDAPGATALNGTVRTTGAQTFNDAVTLGGATTLTSTGGGAITLNTVDGAQSLTVNTSGATTFNGHVGGNTVLTSLTTDVGGTVAINGNVTTSGAQVYNETASLSGEISASSVDFNSALTLKGAGIRSIGAGNIFLSAVDSEVAGQTGLNLSGTSIFLENQIGSTAALASLAATGATNFQFGLSQITTTGAQTYNGNSVLGGTGTKTFVSTGNGDIAFNGTINGALNLVVNTAGSTVFGGAIGGNTALASLTTNSGGSTSISGNISTTGAQSYNDNVVLAANAALTTGGIANVTFAGAVDGAFGLTVNSGGTTSFSGGVGQTTALTSLSTDAGGTTQLRGAITTTGTQTYADNVVLAGATTLTGSTSTFGSVSGSGNDLALNYSGNTTITGATFLGIRNLSTGNGGTTTLAGAINTTGTQTYNDAVTLSGATTLNSSGAGAAGNITIANILDSQTGAQALTINTGGTTTLSGTIGGTRALASLTTDAAGSTTLNSGAVTTTGAQTYADTVNLGAGSHSLTASSVNFQRVNAVFTGTSLLVDVTGAATFNQAVGQFTPLESLGLSAGTASFAATNSVNTLAANIRAGGLGFTNSGTFTVGTAGAISGITATGDVSLASAGGGITLNSNVIALGRVVDFYTFRDISQSSTAGISADILRIVAGRFEETQAHVSLLGANQVNTLDNIFAYGSFGFSNGRALTLTGSNRAANNFSVTTTSGDMTVAVGGSVASTHNGDVTLNAAGNLTVRDVSSVGRYVAGGDVNLIAGSTLDLVNGAAVGDDMSMTAADFAGVALTGPYSGATRDDLTITDTLGGLILGSSLNVPGMLTVNVQNGGGLNVEGALSSTNKGVSLSAGGIVLAEDVTTGTSQSVTLVSTAGISQTAGSIVTGTLSGSSTGTTSLSNSASNNNVVSLGAFTAGAGFSYVDINGFTVTGALGSGAGGLTLDAETGNLGLAADVNAAGQNLQINALAGSVTQTAGILRAATLSGFVSVDTMLTQANEITNLGAFTTNSLNLADVGGLAITGNVQANVAGGDVTIRTTGGNLTIGAAGRLTGRNVALSTDAAFVNNASINPITTNGTGHWVVYAAAPTGNTFGALNSNNTAIWNGNIGSVAPGSVSGNRYVFAFQPTVTFTAADVTKVYGTDLTGAATLYTVSGLQPGVAGAFLGDTAAMAFSGAPVVTSGGLAERASVAGGPYATAISTGSLAGLNGYAVAVAGNGQITVTPKALTATASANNKTYDGNADATGSIALGGIVTGDAVSANGAFTFADKHAADNKIVTASGITLSGADAGNYTVASAATAQANIARRAITVTGSVSDKTYDGTTGASGSLALNGAVVTDAVSAVGSLAFADKTAGIGKAVNVSGLGLTGADAANYTVTLQAPVTGNIAQRAITATASVSNKTYDGTTAATGGLSLNGAVVTDSVSATGAFAFADKNAGTGKAVNVTGLGLTGADAANYIVTLQAPATADIARKAITAIATAVGKTYDGTTDATGSLALNGVAAGDANTVGATGTFAFADKNAGVGKTVNVTGLGLTGADAANYTVTLQAPATADIARKAVTVSATANGKTYDGTTGATGSLALNGVMAGDANTVGATGTFAFADKNAGTGKVVNVGNIALNGADAGNYILTSADQTAVADILRKDILAVAAANSKTYDGTIAATGSLALNGVVAGDSVAASGTFAFADRNAGAAKTVAVSNVTISGADAGNYTVTIPTSALADILRKTITATATANSKTYDGTTAATGTIALDGVVAGDTVTAGGTFAFADKNAGTGKTVTITNAALSGTDAGNYTLTLPAPALADILRRRISGTAVVQDKVYDGTTAANGSVAIDGVVAGDHVSASASFAFADRNAGTGKTVSVNGAALAGSDAGNYVLALPATAIAAILRRAITVTADPQSRLQGQPDPVLTYQISAGSLAAGDGLTGALSRAAGEIPGSYAIGQGSLAASANYELSFVGNSLVIQPRLSAESFSEFLSAVGQWGEARKEDPTLVIDEKETCGPASGDDGEGCLNQAGADHSPGTGLPASFAVLK